MVVCVHNLFTGVNDVAARSLTRCRLCSTASYPPEPEPTPPPPAPAKFHRPVREGRRFMGGHFDPKVTVKA